MCVCVRVGGCEWEGREGEDVCVCVCVWEDVSGREGRVRMCVCVCVWEDVSGREGRVRMCVWEEGEDRCESEGRGDVCATVTNYFTVKLEGSL